MKLEALSHNKFDLYCPCFRTQEKQGQKKSGSKETVGIWEDTYIYETFLTHGHAF